MRRRAPVCLVAALMAILTSSTASPAVIYDNTSSTFMNAVSATVSQLGNEVFPAGTDRRVTLLEVGVYSQHAASTATLQAFLYANDGTGGQPGTLLWQSAAMNRVPLTGDSNDLIAFPVPNVLVPADFTWTLQISNNSGPFVAGLPTYGPPSIGSSAGVSWFGQPGSWTKVTDPTFYYLARITATIPEPSSILLLSVGLGVVLSTGTFSRRSRRR
jgi:hypothetical protein